MNGSKMLSLYVSPALYFVWISRIGVDDIQSDGEACLFLLTCLVVWGFVPNKPGIFKRAGSESSKSRDQKSKHM
jgi:hypothetical protein